MTKKLTLTDLSQTKNSNLSEIIANWNDYDHDTIISTILEYKKRNLAQNELFISKVSEIEASKSSSIVELEKEFLERSGAETYLELKQKLENHPSEEEQRRKLVHQAYREQVFQMESKAKNNSSKDIIVGSLWFLGGAIVTIVSMSNGHGGVVAYGAIIFGAIQFGRGILNSMS